MCETEGVLCIMIRIISVTLQYRQREIRQNMPLEVYIGKCFDKHVTNKPWHVFLAAFAYVVIKAVEI